MAVEAPTSACPRDAGAANERERVERGAAQQPGRGRSLVAEVGRRLASGKCVALWMDGWWRCRWMGVRQAVHGWRFRAGALAAASVGAPNGTDRRGRGLRTCAGRASAQHAARLFPRRRSFTPRRHNCEAVRVSVGAYSVGPHVPGSYVPKTRRKSKMGLEPYREKDAEDQRK